MIDLDKAKAAIASLPSTDLDYLIVIDKIKKGTPEMVLQHLKAVSDMACLLEGAVETIEALQSELDLTTELLEASRKSRGKLARACIEYEIARQSMCVGDRKTAEEIEAEAKAILHDRGLL